MYVTLGKLLNLPIHFLIYQTIPTLTPGFHENKMG